MDFIYSLSLLLSLVAGGLGATISILVAARPDQLRNFRSKLALAAFIFGVTAFLLGMISALVHLVFGHGTGSDAVMTTLGFFGHHKAYWLVLVLSVMACNGWRLAGRQRDKDQRSR